MTLSKPNHLPQAHHSESEDFNTETWAAQALSPWH